MFRCWRLDRLGSHSKSRARGSRGVKMAAQSSGICTAASGDLVRSDGKIFCTAARVFPVVALDGAATGGCPDNSQFELQSEDSLCSLGFAGTQSATGEAKRFQNHMLTIRKAAVIGAGNMGAQIAAH